MALDGPGAVYCRTMQLKPGDLAPGFRVKDIDGRTVDLGEYRGSPVLLCFYRYAGCPYCNLFLHEIIERWDIYKKLDLKVVAFFQSPEKYLKTVPGHQHPDFPLVADPGRVIYDTYGVESSAAKMAMSLLHLGTFIEANLKGYLQMKVDGDFYLMPAEFLVRPDGVIDTVHYARHLADRLSDTEIMNFLSTFRHPARATDATEK